jgi:hypothetical protein
MLPDEAAEDGHADCVAVGLGSLVRQRDQHLARWLLVVPAAFDRREFCWLLVMHVVANEVTEKELRRHQHRGEKQPHAQHDACFGLVFAA